MRFRNLSYLSLVVIALAMAVLACTSDQTWIIHPTATPTITPTRPPVELEPMYEIGQEAIVDAGTMPMLYILREPRVGDELGNRLAMCFAGTTVVIEDIAQDEDVIFYRIDCVGNSGWIPEENLAPVDGGEEAEAPEATEPVQEPEEATYTPEPTDTPSHTPAFEAGQSASVVGDYVLVLLLIEPGEDEVANRAGRCPVGTVVVIDDVGEYEGLFFYKVECGQIEGWISEGNLQAE